MRSLTSATLLVAIAAVASLAAAVPADQDIAISGFAYEHAVVAVNAGEPVTWTNMDSVAHSVTTSFCSDGCVFDSGSMGVGDVYSYAPAEGGTIRYFCRLHAYMEAKLLVQTNDPSDADLRVASSGIGFENAQTVGGLPLPYRYRVSALVENAGGAAARPAVTLSFQSPTGTTTLIGSMTLDIPAHGSAVASAVWDATSAISRPGDYRILVGVDPGNSVVEADETNNAASRLARVTPGGLAG